MASSDCGDAGATSRETAGLAGFSAGMTSNSFPLELTGEREGIRSIRGFWVLATGFGGGSSRRGKGAIVGA